MERPSGIEELRVLNTYVLLDRLTSVCFKAAELKGRERFEALATASIMKSEVISRLEDLKRDNKKLFHKTVELEHRGK